MGIGRRVWGWWWIGTVVGVGVGGGERRSWMVWDVGLTLRLLIGLKVWV